MAASGFGRCNSERKAIRRQLLGWTRDASVLLGLEQVLLRIMEENSALKIRSDLYPKNTTQVPTPYDLASIQMTEDDRAQDLSSRAHPDSRVNFEKESLTQRRTNEPNNYELRLNSDSDVSRRRSPSSPHDAEASPEEGRDGGARLFKPDLVCPTASRESCLVFQDRDRPPDKKNTSSPSPISGIDPGGAGTSPVSNPVDDEEDERIDVVTPDDEPLPNSGVQPLSHAPYLFPPEYLPRKHDPSESIPPLIAPSIPFRPLEAMSRRLHEDFDGYQTAVAPPTATLDLSTSSRSSSSSDHLNLASQTPKMATSPPSSPTQFNPFRVLPGLTRLSEINPLFRDGFEGSLKGSYNPALYAATLPWIISSQIQNLVQYQARSESNHSVFAPYNGEIYSLEDKEQQPLDLSAKKMPIKPLSDEDLVSRVLEIKPSTRGRRRADNNKRSYTEEELHAALKDIQSGKLGTRRAAVIYGIPRSTLRNKVYKLAMERDRNKKLIELNEKAEQNEQGEIFPDSTAHLHSGLRSFLPESREHTGMPSCETLKSILRSKMTEKLDELSQSNQAFLSGLEKQKLLDSSLSYLLENIPKLALNLEGKVTPSEMWSSLSLYPQLQEFTHKIIEERFHEEIKRTQSRVNGTLSSDFTNGYRPYSDDLEINVPSYPGFGGPNNASLFREEGKGSLGSSHSGLSASPQGTLKDMIAQMISQKILSEETSATPPASKGGIPESFLPVSVQRLESSVGQSTIKAPTEERLSQDQAKKRSKSPTSNSGGKGSRPKRGKYRNYDRDNLLKAVQAVQSGEMSVHRAGSFYGVPHSTLEYKVKERHLNRGRNKKETMPPPSSNIQTLLKNSSNPESATPLSGSLPPSSKDLYKTEVPDTTTIDLSQTTENRPSEDVSIINVQPPPLKKPKYSEENDKSYSSSLSITPNPFLSNPFPFWNNASPILAPFLSPHYQPDPLYTTQMMMEIREKMSNHSEASVKASPSLLESKFSEIFSRERFLATQSHHELSNASSVSPSPPPSPQSEGLLNSLLRRRIESASTEGLSPWQIQSATADQSQDGTRESAFETMTNQRLSPGHVPSTGLLTLNALLPSFFAARSSLAAAAALSSEHSGHSSPTPPEMSLIKGEPPMPFVVGPRLTEAP